MPKSRRKAAASRAKARGGVQKDFVKKKEKLGRKARPDNATNTSVRSRQIYLPQIPDEQEVHDASLRRGLTYEQLLQRAGHYNASTRMSALNGLGRALKEPTLAASAHAAADRANVVRLALKALQDEEAVVRRAAVGVLAAAVLGVTVRPFARLLAAAWLAGLSHIRTEVQEAAAGAMTAVFREGVRPVAVFGSAVEKPLGALAEMLGVGGMRNTVKRRVCVLEALLALLEGEKEVARRREVGKKVFYWHSMAQDEEQCVKESMSLEMGKVLAVIVERVANVVNECLPVHEAKKDKGVIGLLVVAAKCLYMALSMGSVDADARKPVLRMLNSWAKDRNRHQEKGSVHVLHNYLAACALVVEKHEMATSYIEVALAHDVVVQTVDGISVEVLVEMVFETMVDEEVSRRLLKSWLARWNDQLDGNNMQYIVGSASIVQKVVRKQLEGGSASRDEVSWGVMSSLPRVIAMACVKVEAEWNEFSLDMLKLLGQVCLLHGVDLKPHVLEFLISEQVVKVMDDAMLDQLMPVLYYSCVFVNVAVLRVATALPKLALKLMAVVETHADQFNENDAMRAYAFTVALGKKDCEDAELMETALRIQTRFEAEAACS